MNRNKWTLYNLDTVRIVNLVHRIVSVQKMHNTFINNYLFLTTLLHVSKFAHHP
jgi:hypothetical protein